ncbi:MAG: Ig-like domain-containing protein [Actinomycetota bacterium]|nr:Ig-like domain-containing protein [Actinomycetota bacterium]
MGRIAWSKRGARRAALLLAVAATAAGPAAHAANAATGYRDFSFGTAASAPTAKEPQSKIWFNDGTWWGSLYSAASGSFHIYRLDWATQTWSDTGTLIDERDTSRSDVLWDGTNLYVVTAGTSETTTSHGARLHRFSYSSAAKTYTVDTGFPITITSSGTQAASIEKDTTGRLWVAFTKSYRTYVAYSTTDDRTWVSPFLVPGSGNSSAGANGLEETAIVAFDSKIGIMYSNQNDWAYYFAIHNDGDPGNVWTQTVANQGTEESDNHLNAKGLDGDPAGNVYAIAKTSLNASSDPLYLLLVRKPDGTWTKRTVVTVADDWTRAQVAIDTSERELYVFGSSPCCSGGTIYYKKTSLDSPSFATGKGTPLIESTTDTHINNPSTSKQELSSTTGFVAIASDDRSDTYLHSAFDLGASDTTAPDTTITGGPANGSTTTATDVTFSFVASEAGSTFECSLDGAAFGACTSPKAYAGLADGTHTFEVRAIDGAGNVDASPAGRTWAVNTQTETVTFSAEADARVEELAPTTNYGADPKLSADLSPNVESYLRFDVAGLDMGVLSAKLRLYAVNGSSNGPAVYRAGDAWTEAGIVWSNKPARIGAVLEDRPLIQNKAWAEYDVTSAVTGNGLVTFNLRPTSKDGADFNSREAASAYKPQLVIQAETDRTPPETTIDSGPSGPTKTTDATFTFSSSEPGSTFECSFDAAAFGPCASPVGYGALTDGSHTFEVRAMDASLNLDPTPASRTWTVDTVAPSAPVLTSPDDGTTSNTGAVLVSGTAEPESTVDIFDGAAYAAVAVADGAGAWSESLTGLADGPHTYTATATDAAGNASPVSNARAIVVDTVPPGTAIDSGPSGATASAAAAFAFSADEAGSTFECSLDGAAFGACTSPKAYAGLVDGTHTFEVRAIDGAGNADATPASRTWTVDVTAPSVGSVSPADGATGVATSAVVEAVFSEDMDASTISTSTMTLVEQATSIAVAATVTYDAATRTARLDPTGLLFVSTTYDAVVAGGADGVHDLAGNPLAQSRTWSFTTDGSLDTTPPETTIESGPTGATASAAAEFAFSADEAGSTFECSLDGAVFGACTSPKGYAGLAQGSHTFEVRATDRGGNTDATPASRTWTVDTIAPDAPVITTPADGAKTDDPTVTVSGTAEANSAVEVFDGSVSRGSATADGSGGWSTTLAGLADGSHTLTAKATDAAGNTSSASSGVTVTVDTVAPDTAIDSGPSGTTASTGATFTFSSSEPNSSFECSLDGAAFTACASPKSYTELAETAHTFAVRATDGVGHVDATPASRSWTVDLTLFSDGFESGDFSAWSLLRTGGDGTATVQSAIVKTGGFAARLSETVNTGSFAYVRKALASAQTEITAAGDFQITQEGASGGNVPIFRLFDPAGARIVSLYRQNLDGNKIRITHGGVGYSTTGILPLGTWGRFQLHVITAGTGASTIEVRLNGALVYQTTTASLGTAGVLNVQLGNETAKQAFTLVADDVTVRAE